MGDTPRDKTADKTCDNPGDKKVKTNQFDKFKRRLIRTVARMLITEKVDKTEMWKTMNKETGRDCKTIWEHMRALTLRKLSRLLAADDYVTRVGEVARMSPVDWLQFDLVLVHEDIDVWDLSTASNKSLSKLTAPWDLLQLAYQHDVIHSFGEQLALTWATVTVHYNRNGRQCSPMLLQKRWHQLLRQTRDKFYVFWYEYRGADTRINQAMEVAPSPLEYAVTKCYPQIVTNKFPKWLEAMQDGQHRIVLVNELQQVMRDKQREKLIEEGPELVLMEPKYDTIEIGDDSDEEKADNDRATTTDTGSPNEDNTKTADEVPAPPKIKEEPPDEHIENLDPDEAENGLSNVKIVTAAHLTTAEIVDNDVAQLDLIEKDENVLDENPIDDNDIECVVLSPDNPGNKVAPLLNLEINTSELVTESPELTENKIDLATDDLNQTKIIADDVNKKTDLNTNKKDCNTSEGGITVIAKELDNAASIQAESSINPKFLSEDQPVTQELSVGGQETITVTSVDMDTDLNTNKTDLNLPEADIIKKVQEFYGETNITTSIKDEPLIGTIEFSEENYNTNNICISETRSLTQENLNNTPCSEVQDMTVKIEHTIQAENEENTISEVNTVSSEVISEEQFGENFTKSDSTNVTVPTNNIENNDSRNIDPDLIDTRTSDMEEDIIMYDPTLNDNIDNTLESFTSTNDVKITIIPDDSESMQIVDDGVDDGEYLVDDESVTDLTTQPQDTSGNSDEIPTIIDLKLIMNAIVFTTKLDNMKSFKNRSFEEVKSDALINKVLQESKPVKLQTKVEAIPNLNSSATGEKPFIYDNNENQNHSATDKKEKSDENPTIDLNKKQTNDDTQPSLNPNSHFRSVETNIEIKMEVDNNENENMESNTVRYSEMDGCQDDQTSSEDEYEDVRINPDSKVFKKPSNLSYNPVQLCKNPDFNTRLKRIPILFYTYQSNKDYLKECKPLTIDLDKGFERKMYNNTIYLKRDPNMVRVKEASKIQNTVSEADNIHEANKQPDSVELTTQNKGNEVQVKLETVLDISSEELITERKRKLISLHDIVKVRRINQQLLTAEISPIVKYESDNSNSCETVDLTSKPDSLPVTEMNVVKEEAIDPKVLIPENPSATNTTSLNQQPFTQPAKLAKPKNAPKKPSTPWYLKKTPFARPKEKSPAPSNETVEHRVRRIYGDSLLTQDSVNKMLLILENDAVDDEHAKRFFDCNFRVMPLKTKLPPAERKTKKKKIKLSTEVVDQNINQGELISKNFDDDDAKKMQKEEEVRKPDLEKKKNKRERYIENRKRTMRQKKIEIGEIEKSLTTPKFNIIRRNNELSSLTSVENKSSKQLLTAQKTNVVKCKMLCRTPVQCYSTPVYSLRGFDGVPKMTMFSDHGIVRKGAKAGGLSFLVRGNGEKKLTMSPIILRNYGHNEKSTESRIMPKPTEIRPSPVPLSREKVKLNMKPKDIVLSAKFLSMFPENSSFGKDKIILTTANLDCFEKIDEPSPVKATPAPIVHSDSQQLFPPFAVPEGVRFYFTATGDVVGTVDACITDPNVTNSIPFYVTAIKDMLLSASTSKEADADSVSAAIDITQCVTTENSTEIETVANTIDINQSETDGISKSANARTPVALRTSNTPVELTQLESTKTAELMADTASIATNSKIDQCLNSDELNKTDSVVPAPTLDTNIMEISQNSECASQGNNTFTTEEESNKLQEPMNSASLTESYSTSGDTIEKNKSELIPAYVNIPNLTNDHLESNSGQKKSILSDLMAMTGITSEDIMTSRPEVPEVPEPTLIPVTSIVPVTPVERTLADYFSHSISENTDLNLKKLTPVTSFEMLKYANTQKAEFYKLDLITGDILPITVGFKRVKTYAKRNNIRTVQMHSTIDLTEDADEGGDSESNKASTAHTTLQRARLPDDDDELPAFVYKPQPRSRKQNLQPRSYEATQADGVINLSEFDEAVEEDYLEDSNGSQRDTEPEDETRDESDEDAIEQLSSDEDEPLSTVISRRNSKEKKARYVVAINRGGQSSINESDTEAQCEPISRPISRENNELCLDNNEDMEADLELYAGLRAAMNRGDVDASMNESDGDASMNESDGSDEDFILGV